MEAYFLGNVVKNISGEPAAPKKYFYRKNSLEKLLTSFYLFNTEDHFFSLFF
ncbi:hypothetical protein SAMN05880573_103151 [Chryseobacterium sp. RU33C]|nr:hypothetical protein SAMN05880573_103151 [Chryseobacterium sp. RU33C]